MRQTSPHSSIAGCILQLGQPLYRKVIELGVSGQYQAVSDFRIRVKILSVLAAPPPWRGNWGYELIGPASEDDRREFVSYFEETHIGGQFLPGGEDRSATAASGTRGAE